MTEFHRILNVSRTATLQEIKKAYRELALKFHPDLNPPEKRKEVEARFIKITEAYKTLSDMKIKGEDFIGDPQSSNYDWSQEKTRRQNSNFYYQRTEEYTGSNFNTKAWNAWHYGQDTTWVDAVQFRSRVYRPSNPTKHQSYFYKKRMNAHNLNNSAKQAARENLEKMREERIRNVNRRGSRDDCTIS